MPLRGLNHAIEIIMELIIMGRPDETVTRFTQNRESRYPNYPAPGVFTFSGNCGILDGQEVAR